VIGAVPSGCEMEANTMTRWTNAKNIIVVQGFINLEVNAKLGRRHISNQNGCGPNVATLNPLLIKSRFEMKSTLLLAISFIDSFVVCLDDD